MPQADPATSDETGELSAGIDGAAASPAAELAEPTDREPLPLPASFAFQHKLFTSSEEALFRRSTDESKEPLLILIIAGNQYALPFPGIRQEFGIAADTADSRMLDLVEEALYYKRTIRQGDPIPNEMVTGEASWEITDEHRRIAHQRIHVQLANWLTGEGSLITDPNQLQQIADDPGTRTKVNDALERAAQELDLGENGKEILLDQIEALAEDLAGIEALRDYLDRIRIIQQKVGGLIRAFRDEMSILDIAMSADQLIKRALGEFTEEFELLDAQTGEIISVLKNLDAQTKFIRESRDSLHEGLMDWDEIFEKFGPARVSSSQENGNLLREAYRFLAPRYMQVDQWDLHNSAA